MINLQISKLEAAERAASYALKCLTMSATIPDVAVTKWFTFSRLPLDLRLEYQMPGGTDPMTPPEVRARYEKTSKDKFVVWAAEDQMLVGFKEGIDEVTLQISAFKKIALVRSLPAKGSGMISLETQIPSRYLIAGKSYSAESDAWISNVVEALKSILGERVIVEPLGCDA